MICFVVSLYKQCQSNYLAGLVKAAVCMPCCGHPLLVLQLYGFRRSATLLHALDCTVKKLYTVRQHLKRWQAPYKLFKGLIKVVADGYRRHLMDSGGSQTDQNTSRSYATPSQLDQDVVYSYYGVFRQTFNHFANTNLSNYTLLPINGTCSSGAALPMPVTDCVANNRMCCYNATRVQVRL